MDFDNPKGYGDTSITDGLVFPAQISIIFQPPGLFSLAWAGGDSDDPEVRNDIKDSEYNPITRSQLRLF